MSDCVPAVVSHPVRGKPVSGRTWKTTRTARASSTVQLGAKICWQKKQELRQERKALQEKLREMEEVQRLESEAERKRREQAKKRREANLKKNINYQVVSNPETLKRLKAKKQLHKLQKM